jgi:hypothetical protein
MDRKEGWIAASFMHDIVNPRGGDADGLGERINGEVEGLQKFLAKNFSGVDGRHVAHVRAPQ